MGNKLRFLLTIFVLSTSIIGCSPKETTASKDISIIYTSDVHCGLADNLGYSSFYAYKEELEKTNQVTTIDAGDFLQGDYVGAISKGKYIVDVMNQVGYDIATLGNHEFDYGIDELRNRINEFKGDIISCNVSYIGKNENKLSKIKPYIIKDYGYKKVGYVGVTTPTTLVASDPTHFLEDDEIAYSFGAKSVESFYEVVQENIDKCKKDGADYIVMVSHLGSTENYSPYRSIDVINHTSGADVFLDGHAHISLPWTTYKNKDNADTLLVDVGYKLNNFASLTISKDGTISHEFYDKYEKKSEKINNLIDDINKQAEAEGSKVVANIDVDLKIADENNIRMVRVRETPIGNLISDAYRLISGADIGVVNGGGIRVDLKKGDVTYKDIKSVHPFGNILMKKKTTGAKILDYLEFASMKTERERVKDGRPFGESGAFANVSGLKYKIDTSIPTSVVVDESGAFVKIDGTRRVKDVKVLENNEYVDIDPDKEYVIASHNFLLDAGGDGANMFKDDQVIPSEQKFDYEVVIDYIVEVLKGHLKEKYSTTENRIVVL